MFSFRTLGSLELRSESGEEITGVLAGQKLVALLAYLAVGAPRGLHRRDSVVGLLWPELTQERARAALRHSIYRLRGSLGPAALVSRGDEDIGVDQSIIVCDAARFEELLEAGLIGNALDLYRGDLLPGFFLRGAPEFERWLDGERTRLRHCASSAACKLADAMAGEGRRDEAVMRARQSLSIDPDDEQLLRRILGILAAAGDSAGAVREYDAFAKRMKEDYDSSPAPETRALAAKLRASAGEMDAGPSEEKQKSGVMGPPPITISREHYSSSVARGLEPAKPSRNLRRSIVAGVAALVIVAGYGARRVTADTSAIPPTIAVMPFDVRGSKDLEYLREGMSDLLSIGVDGAAGLHSADPRAVLARVQAEGKANVSRIDPRQIARDVGASLYITGSVVEAGGLITITAALRNADGRIQSTAQTRAADKGKVFELVDELARQLLAGADRAAPELAGLAARTTKSMPALRSYLAGERELRAGRHLAALDAFRQAVEDDSTFALAYYRLSSAGRWTTEYSLAENATDRAVRYNSSLPPYARRLTDAAAAMRKGEYARSESLYVASTRGRPGDAETWFGLGDLHYHYNAIRGRSRGEARKAFEKALALDAGDGESRVHLLELAAWEGRIEEVDALLSGLPSGSDFGAKWPIVRALITGDTQAERNALAALQSGDERAIVMMVIHSTSAFPSNLPGAARVVSQLTHPSRSPARRAYGYNLRAQVEVARGRWGAARNDLTAMAALEPAAAIEYGAILSLAPGAYVSTRDMMALRSALKTWDAGPTPPSSSPVFGIHNGFHSRLRLYLLGLVSTRVGDTAATLRYADSLKMMPADSITSLLSSNLSRALRARVIDMRGKPAEALAALGEPWVDPRTHRSHYSSILAQVADRYARAEMLQRAGRLGEAVEAYSSVADYSLDGLMYLPMSHLRRGDILLQLGERQRAIAHYAKFVEMWKDCDPELRPLRLAAEKKIAALTIRR